MLTKKKLHRINHPAQEGEFNHTTKARNFPFSTFMLYLSLPIFCSRKSFDPSLLHRMNTHTLMRTDTIKEK